MSRYRLIPACAALVLAAACTTPPTPPAPPSADGWRPVPLPGKRATRYEPATKGGRPAVLARAERSASLWRRDWPLPGDRLGEVRFSWWVDAALPGADLATAGLDDAPARVLFAFDGDHARLSTRNRMLFDLAETLGGERPPYATLMYVFGNRSDEVDRTIVHPRSDRVRKIVVDAGPQHLGRWREHRRDLAADFQRAFGEPPGRLLSVALMTDADNTQQAARAWYGPVEVLPRAD
jgi:hypothetical protein